jgi:hypothetical protein
MVGHGYPRESDLPGKVLTRRVVKARELPAGLQLDLETLALSVVEEAQSATASRTSDMGGGRMVEEADGCPVRRAAKMKCWPASWSNTFPIGFNCVGEKSPLPAL